MTDPASISIRPAPAGLVIRPARPDELPICAEIWRESLNDYIVRLNQPPIPDDLGAINRLYQHLAETDPERFVVAVDDALGTIAGFASAVVRGRLWFLSMCFVRPDRQAGGIGRALVEAILPPAGSDMVLATATDSAQPISNALYSGFGIVPRMPLFSISGYVTEPESLPGLPAGVVAVPFESVVADRPGGSGHAELGEAVGALDRELLGVEHPQDHRFLRIGGRHGFLYRDANGANLGYGYAAESGRIGPLAVGDPALLGPALGQLLRAVPFRGAQAVWVPGLAGPAVTMLLQAGLRFEDFPILIAWNRPFADFERYLPISPGLL
jgi:GNAT superfamily N-acetyltransferase